MLCREPLTYVESQCSLRAQQRNNGASMPKRSYSASLSQTQGRTGYSIIFRHPARRDEATGRPGVRVRKGLGTRDEAEAERLRDQLNELLASPRYHDPAARAE